MTTFRFEKAQSIAGRGADAGCILRGLAPNNHGLRLQIQEQQVKECVGPIQGCFVILATGENRHSYSLSGLLGKVTDAGEVLRVIRATSPACVSVVNANILALEA